MGKHPTRPTAARLTDLRAVWTTGSARRTSQVLIWLAARWGLAWCSRWRGAAKRARLSHSIRAASGKGGSPSGYISVNSHPLTLVGSRCRIEGRGACITATRPIEGCADESNLFIELVDEQTRRPLQYRDPETGEKQPFTLAILRDLYAIGKASFSGEPESATERQGRFATMDPHAIIDRDPKARWKANLAQRALQSRVKRTDRECRNFLEDHYGTEQGDFDYPKPSPSTLRRWMSKLVKSRKDASVLASLAGRPKGRSQLDPVVDGLVHEAALYFWTRPRAQVMDAFSWLSDQIDRLPPKNDGSSHLCPSKQTLYKRVDALRCYDTVKAKHGEKEAERRYRGSGENLVVNDLLDVVLMDATTLEQAWLASEVYASGKGARALGPKLTRRDAYSRYRLESPD